MAASRDLSDALRAMMSQFDANVVPSLVPRGPAPAARSGEPLPPTGGGGGNGAVGAYPLTETAYAARQWWPEKSVTTTDGLFAIRFKPIKQATFLDANGKTMTLNFKGPG